MVTATGSAAKAGQTTSVAAAVAAVAIVEEEEEEEAAGDIAAAIAAMAGATATGPIGRVAAVLTDGTGTVMADAMTAGTIDATTAIVTGEHSLL